MAYTNIEWADRSWNPVVGCSIVSPGCTNCYAMAMAHRINQMTLSSYYEGLTERSKNGKGRAVWTGKMEVAPEYIFIAPLRWKKPCRIFVNSMGDLFHESVPDDWIDRVFAVMAMAPQHTFIVLTKRARRMREYLIDVLEDQQDCRIEAIADAAGRMMDDGDNAHDAVANMTLPLPNVWLGVSTEDQARADEHIPDLLATPAEIRFVSAEPLLGPIDFTRIAHENGQQDHYYHALDGYVIDGSQSQTEKLDWIICGGESGPGARPMHVEWARSIRDQCKAADVPFFMKQLGANVIQDGERRIKRDRKGADMSEWPHDLMVREFPDELSDIRSMRRLRAAGRRA